MSCLVKDVNDLFPLSAILFPDDDIISAIGVDFVLTEKMRQNQNRFSNTRTSTDLAATR